MTTDTYTITYQQSSGTVFTLNGFDSDHGLTISYLGDQNFGLAPLHRITTRGPLQHGDSDIDFRLDPRVLQVPLLVQNSSASPKYNHYAIRQTLLSIFRPQTLGYLRITTGNGVSTITRQIAVQVLGGLSFDVDPTEFHVRTVVQLRADDPTWYEPINLNYQINNANIGINQTISTTGNWPSFPTINITGPITNPTITNNTTGQSIAITAAITAGTVYVINLEYGQKTVIEAGTLINRISTVSATSSLATWSLQPGNNSVVVTGTGTAAGTQVSFSYNNRFTGI